MLTILSLALGQWFKFRVEKEIELFESPMKVKIWNLGRGEYINPVPLPYNYQ